ncbi:hypothetical protein [uncultured Faecalibaculum sp.]|uniref:hypothetical protein n=1 Tax=uncultured Faecalibaculum sp. TaxID=1729681 RepID=UPI0025E95991|nr:hypothetical protein [uncultured Faecalibaculum sp.]
MNIEITPDHRKLYIYNEENRILKRYPVLLTEGEWILFLEEKDGRDQILAARVAFDAQGCIAAFDWHLDKEQWHELHALWKRWERTHRRT